MVNQTVGNKTLRIGPFGRERLMEGLRRLGVEAELSPSRWVYIEVSTRECRDRSLDYRWATEKWNQVNHFVEGATALVRMHGFLAALDETVPRVPSNRHREMREADPSERLATHVMKFWREY
jgi:hypothetical protein